MRGVYNNLCPATINASLLAANIWKNCLGNVESDNNKILYETLLDFFTTKRYLLPEEALVIYGRQVSSLDYHQAIFTQNLKHIICDAHINSASYGIP